MALSYVNVMNCERSRDGRKILVNATSIFDDETAVYVPVIIGGDDGISAKVYREGLDMYAAVKLKDFANRRVTYYLAEESELCFALVDAAKRTMRDCVLIKYLVRGETDKPRFMFCADEEAFDAFMSRRSSPSGLPFLRVAEYR